MSETKTGEIKPNETKPKKMVRSSVAIALGIICILLIAFIAYFSITGISAQNSYNNLQNQNKQLQTWLDGNETLLNQTQTWLIANQTLLSQTQGNNTNLQNQIDNLNSTITNLQTQISNLNATAHLEVSEVLQSGWFLAATSERFIGQGSSPSPIIPYAGYLKAAIEPSDNTYVEVSYNSQGGSLDYEVPVNANGIGMIPVLPTNSIEIGYGNLTIGANYTVTITYYY